MKFEDKNVLVVGMARSGIAAAALLLRQKAKVFLYDAKPIETFDGLLDKLIEHGAVPYLGKDAPVEEMDCLVLSPGVPLTIPVIQRAMEKEIPVISEIELGYLTAGAKIVAISGTNGKTTTTALTGEIFKNAGAKTYVLGNIGIPISEKSDKTLPDEIIVAETAALQLETTIKFHPRACALLNVTEDHLDRYGTMENYTEAKARMFDNQTSHDFAVLNYDNEITRGLKYRVRAKLFWFSTKTILDNGAFLKDGRIIFKKDGAETDICGIDEVRIPGMHNIENALAATVLASVMGIGAEVIAQTLKTFPGVEHRIEYVGEVNGIQFINDSKGTNPDATIKAIGAMKRPTILILGGYDKHLEFDSLFAAFTDSIKGIVVLGECGDQIMETAKRAGFTHAVQVESFEQAVFTAYHQAESGDTVLLSPACASWDMFDNFEQRGQVFKQIVKEKLDGRS